MKKVLVIATQTVQSYALDRVFHAVLVLALLLIGFSVFLSTLTIVEQRKILLDFGFAAVSLVGVGFGILLGSTIVRKEMDSRTIYTILSKPVGRGEYLWGKFLGGALVILAVHAICGGALVLVLKLLGAELPQGLLSAFYLMNLEGVLVLALALTLSLWCSSLFLGATLALAGFLIGRSNHGMQQMAEKSSGATRWLLRGLSDVFPSLQRFDIRDVVAYGKPYPADMVSLGTLYCVAYVLALMMIAMFLFRRKDLP